MLARKMGWPFIPEIHLFHDKEKCRRFMLDRLGESPEFIDNAGAQTWCDNNVAVVFMDYSSDDRAVDYGLLVHEACHVVQMQCDFICEENPGDEYIAYCTQVVSQALFIAHDKWMRKHR